MTDELRIVHDDAPTIGRTWCLKRLRLPEHQAFLCVLKKGHRGQCLPFGRAPRPDVTEQNPAYGEAS